MDARTNLLSINCTYLSWTLRNSTAAVRRDNMHNGALLNFNHAELSPANHGLIAKIKSHKTVCEQVGG